MKALGIAAAVVGGLVALLVALYALTKTARASTMPRVGIVPAGTPAAGLFAGLFGGHGFEADYERLTPAYYGSADRSRLAAALTAPAGATYSSSQRQAIAEAYDAERQLVYEQAASQYGGTW